jgi:VanZ family protein
LQPLRNFWQSSIVQQRICLLIACIVVFNLFYLGTKPIAVDLFLPPWDKVAHYVVFSCITALLWFGTNGRLPLVIVLIVAVIGGLDELHQSTLPERQADFLDFATDVVAALCTGYLLDRINRWRHRNLAAQSV